MPKRYLRGQRPYRIPCLSPALSSHTPFVVLYYLCSWDTSRIDFHDDDDAFKPTPFFGRTGQTSLWGSTGSGLESPTTLTPQPSNERSYFHSRGDSIASQDSGQSVQLTTRRAPKAPFTHSTQSSVATNGSSPFTKKPSFASLRNPFKSTKHADVPPPVPPLDHQAYPALKNPFNRSTSSLAHAPPVPSRGQTMNMSVGASPPHFRPSTPAEGRVKSFRARETQYARSQHSQSGSIFHVSDNGSDGGGFTNPFSSSPPPVPPMPNGLGGSNDDVSSSEYDDKIVLDPRTPSDYALHAVFIRFAATAEAYIDKYLRYPLVSKVCYLLGTTT